MSESEAVGVTDVSKRYFDGDKSIMAVAGVTLSVSSSKLIVLRGSSGSGKTTLLGLLGGMIAPTSGDVRVGGRSMTHLRDHHRTAWRRQHVGFVFQDLALVPKMSLLENVLLPLVPAGGPSGAQLARARELLGHFGLADREKSPPSRLSGGERQRGALARALITDPAVLLLDEPTAHVDAESAERVLALLFEQRDAGRSIVVSTHDPRVADDPRVDETIHLERGRVVSG